MWIWRSIQGDQPGGRGSKRVEKEARTTPVKGTMWCSHNDEMVMSRTRTISSWSSAKTASLMTSDGSRKEGEQPETR